MVLGICIALFCACGNGPSSTTESTAQSAETAYTPAWSSGPEALQGKKIIFIGNSYTFWGQTVLNKGTGVLSQAEHSNDQGYFRQANPNVCFLLLVPQMAPEKGYAWLQDVEALKGENIRICNWGGMLHDISQGTTQVPGATVPYSRSSWWIHTWQNKRLTEQNISTIKNTLKTTKVFLFFVQLGVICGRCFFGAGCALCKWKAKTYNI